MTGRRLLVALTALVALAVAGCGDSTTTGKAATTTTAAGSAAPVGSAPKPPIDVSGVSVLDFSKKDDGEKFTMKAPKGKFLLVYFGYLSCPDICPLTMADTLNGLRKLGPDAADFAVSFVTVDPERDKGLNIRSYLNHFFADYDFHALFPPSDMDLRSAAYTFGVRYTVEPHEPNSGKYYGVAHTGDTYVVDDTGHVVWVIPYGSNGDKIATVLTTIHHSAMNG